MPQGILTMFRDDREVVIRIDWQAFLILSRKHCRILREGGAFLIEDLDGRNGT